MKLSNTPEAEKWLNQFKNLIERNLMRNYIDSLVLVSRTKFSHYIEKSIKKIVNNIPKKDRVALITVPKESNDDTEDLPSADNAFGLPRITTKLSKKHKQRIRHTSAGMIGYDLTRIERTYSNKIIVDPNPVTMVNQKIKHYIIVDDIIGSGSRICSFWLSDGNKKLRSLFSYGLCNVFIVCYAATDIGIKNLKRKMRKIDNKNIFYQNQIKKFDTSNAYSKKVIDTLKKYSSKTNNPHSSLGYKNSFTNIIFEHSCPNNTPSILWSSSKEWSALFPGRGVPSNIGRHFGKYKIQHNESEALWNSGQYQLALSIVDEAGSRTISKENRRLITILGLISKGIKYKNLHKVLTFKQTKIEKVLELLKELYLVDSNLRITEYGKSLLEIVKKVRKGTLTAKVDVKDDFYYTKQFMNVKCVI